ncbi:MAG: DUF2065 domain-containing protein [Desulfobacteraceae bacterium]|nr:DUF2065 domain-containing protein [Desulfobacteraceae bacterium]
MNFLLTLLGLILVIEGIPYFVFPDKMKAFMRELEKTPTNILRWIGFIIMILGLGICYLTQRLGIFLG